MRAYAHPDLELSGTTLSDEALGTKYILTTDAAWLLKQLYIQPDVPKLVDVVMRQKRSTRAAARHAVFALLGILNVFGGVRIDGRNISDWLLGLRLRALWTRRYPGNLIGFLRSMNHAYGLLLCLLVAPLPIYGWLMHATVPLVLLVTPGLVCASCIAHEMGHVLVARFYHVPYIFLARPTSAAIMYREPSRRQAQAIAGFGPLLAVLWCAAWVGVVGPHKAGCLFLAAAAIHAVSLTPFFADGRTLWRNI
jgi:hypothetical protein